MRPAGTRLTYNRGMIEIDILLPFGRPPGELAGDLLKQVDAPALAALTSRTAGDIRRQDGDSFERALPHERWLAGQFGMTEGVSRNGSPPVAAALMQAFDLPASAGAWFVLQPVHIHIARDHLVLTDPRQLAFSEPESRSLFGVAQALFEEAGKRLLYGNAMIWFVDAGDWSALQTATPDAASGRNIDIWMPSGAGERDWRKVQNDVQMHWFNHPVNEARESRGQRPVNSVWLWGGPASPGPALPGSYDKAFNLTGWTQAFRSQVPERREAADAHGMLVGLERRNLLVLDDLLSPALSNDWSRWIEAMHGLEEAWFAPLLRALKSGAVDRISIVATHDTGTAQFSATRLSLRKFWVKPTLATLCQ